MTLERDHNAERLARIDQLLTSTRETVATMVVTDRALARDIAEQLDAMLAELTLPKNPDLLR